MTSVIRSLYAMNVLVKLVCFKIIWNQKATTSPSLLLGNAKTGCNSHKPSRHLTILCTHNQDCLFNHTSKKKRAAKNLESTDSISMGHT